MKKLLLTVVLVGVMSVLAACGNNEDTFAFGADQAIEHAAYFINESGSMNQIKEVVDKYEYETKDGAKAVIFEVRLGTDNVSVSATEFVKVWRNNSEAKIQTNWSNAEELEEKKQEA